LRDELQATVQERRAAHLPVECVRHMECSTVHHQQPRKPHAGDALAYYKAQPAAAGNMEQGAPVRGGALYIYAALQARRIAAIGMAILKHNAKSKHSKGL